VIFQPPARLTIRHANKTDHRAISRLVNDNWAVHTRILAADIESRLDEDIAFVVEDQFAVRGFLMVEPQPPQFGLIVVAALHDNSRIAPFLALTLPAVEQELRQLHLSALLQIGEAPWLTHELPGHDFLVVDRVITFEWRNRPLPNFVPHPRLQIRPAHLADLPELLALDHVVFGPTWQKPRATFREAMARAAAFTVGFLDGRLVAYIWWNRFNAHAHLTRLATHPDFQGQGIGATLLRHTMQNIMAANIKTISLNTQIDNERSQNLYRRFGFRATPHIIHVYQKNIGG